MKSMKSEKIVVDFTRIENIVIANVVNTPADIIGKGMIIENERFVIESIHFRDLNNITLFLHGSKDVDDDQLHLVAHTYKNAKEAKDAIEGFKNLITEFNSKRGENAVTNLKWERAE